jgi:hypothetical protein
MKLAIIALVVGMSVVLNAAVQGKTGVAQSSTAQIAQIQKQIELLKVHKGESPYLNIQEKGGDAIIQLARISSPGKTSWSLNIAYYPSKEKPAKALSAVGMSLPLSWKEEQFEAETSVQYGVPASDLPKLPQFIHDLFVKFFKRPSNYQLEFSIETSEPPPVDLTQLKTEIKVTPNEASKAKTKESASAEQSVSFNGIVSISKQGNEITRLNIGNVDDDMKTSYDIVLDKKGKELADSKNARGIIPVKGHVVVKNGKKMLVVEDFGNKQPAPTADKSSTTPPVQK